MKEQTDSKVPQIRFKGFEENWEEKMLGTVVNVTTGKLDANAMKSDGIYDFYTSGIKKYKIDVAAFYGPAITVAGNGATVGYMHLADGEFNAYQRTYVLNNFTADRRFIFYSTGIRLPKKINEEARTGNIPYIVMDMLTELELSIPGLTEQTQIGEYFRELDSLIGLHQRKHDKLVVLKKAMLEKMFPQAGATTPEIRFKGFSGDWVEKKLHSLADRYDNLRVPISASNRIPGNTPYYGANGIQDYVDGYTHEGEFILVAEDGANDLKNYPVQYVSGKIWVNNHAHVLQGKQETAETQFLKYAFSQMNVEAFLVGGGRSKLNAETMMQMEMCVPIEFPEQKHIGNYFSRFDELITKHAIQLKKLKQIKSACLEKMFV